MKNLITLFAMLFIPFISFAQYVEFDWIEDDGRRQITSYERKEIFEGIKYYFSLNAVEKNNIVDYCILVSSFNYIPDNAKILIKLNGGEIIDLSTSDRMIESNKSTTYYTYMIGNSAFTSPINSNSKDVYVGVFDITEEQLEKIKIFGITKLRISSRSSYFEKSYKNNALGEFLTHCWYYIDQRVKTEVKSIYKDF